MSYADDPVAHVRVEMGADGYLHVKNTPAEDLTTRPAFDAQSIDYLGSAYRETYRVAFDRAKLLRSHRAVSRFTPWLLRVDRIIGCRFLRRGRGLGAGLLYAAVYGPLKIYARLLNRTSFYYALTHTVPPSPWLVEGITGVIGSFADRYHEHYATNLANLPHFNLDLGVVEGATPAYPLARKAVADLAALGGTEA